MWSKFAKAVLRVWSCWRFTDVKRCRPAKWDELKAGWDSLAQGENMSSTDDALTILDAVKKTYKDVPWYKGANLDWDDAGAHVVVHAQKSAIPPEGVDHIGIVDGVRVLVAVHS